jgi:energy-coupling factor transport system substrate-specific component
MRELFSMWKNTRMIVLTAVAAAAYVATVVPFKGFVIIPGLTEVRPGAAVPVVLSFLFGPAAAWGAGIGNLIADMIGGTLGPGSVFGFLGNFIYGFLPYAMWRALMGRQSPTKAGVKGYLVLGGILVVNCLAIGSVIGWGVDLLGLFPFAALGLVIAVNNLIASAAIAIVLLFLLYDRVAVWNLLYFQILDDEEEAPKRSKLALIGTLLCIGGAVLAFSTGLIISGEALGAGYGTAAFAAAAEAKGSFAVSAGMGPGLLVLLIGLLLL